MQWRKHGWMGLLVSILVVIGGALFSPKFAQPHMDSVGGSVVRGPQKLYVVDQPVGGDEGKIRVLDANSGKELHVIDTHTNPQIALSPDGSLLYLATNNLDQTNFSF